MNLMILAPYIAISIIVGLVSAVLSWINDRDIVPSICVFVMAALIIGLFAFLVSMFPVVNSMTINVADKCCSEKDVYTCYITDSNGTVYQVSSDVFKEVNVGDTYIFRVSTSTLDKAMDNKPSAYAPVLRSSLGQTCEEKGIC